MIKVKLFECDTRERLENQINAWLEEVNGKIEIVHSPQIGLLTSNSGFIMIFYKMVDPSERSVSRC